jgi:GT2 family glycosyltransferase
VNDIVGAIVARNGGADLAAAAGDLIAAFGAAGVLVVDNASTDGALPPAGVTIRRLPENRGFAAGANAALAWAKERGATGLLLLNQDARIDLAGVRRLTELFGADPTLGAAFAKVVRLDQPYVLAGLAGRRNFRHKLTSGLGGGAIDCGAPATPLAVPHGHGAALLLRVEAARAVGGFDEFLFAYHEEVDLCWRLARAHYGIWLEPRAVVRHRGPGGDPARRAAKAYFLGRNSLLVARKNGGAGAWLRVAGWAVAAALLYYGPRALAGDAEARGLLAGWRDGWLRREASPAVRSTL